MRSAGLVQAAAVLLAAGLVCPLLPRAAGANLVDNGDFEETRAFTPGAWWEFAGEGWSLLGAGLYPEGWQLGLTSPFHVPGYVEVVESPAQAKSGKRFLRLSTPGGSAFLRTSLRGRFHIPPSKAVRWSLWMRGTYGLDRAGQIPEPRCYVTFLYRSAAGEKSGGESSAEKAALTWKQMQGTAYFPDAVDDTGTVVIHAYQYGSREPATLMCDGFTVEETPAPAAERSLGQRIQREREAAPHPVARRDYTVPEFWRPLPVCGKSFWFMFSDTLAIRRDWFPELWDLASRSAAFVDLKLEPAAAWRQPEAPFVAYCLRWNENQFHDPAVSAYGVAVPLPRTFQPRKAFDGVATDAANGWIAAQPPPQTLELDLGLAVPLGAVRITCPWGEGRSTAYALEASPEGQHWSSLAQAEGPNPAAGRQHQVPGAPLRYLRITVTRDSAQEAQIVEVEALDPQGQRVPLIYGEASSVKPFTPLVGGVLLQDRIAAALQKHGDRFLGLLIPEWENDIGTGKLDKWNRSTRDPARYRQLQAGYDFRFTVPATAAESARELESAWRHIDSVYGPGRSIAMCGWNGWEHYGCEFGSRAAFEEISHWSPEPVRHRLAFGRGAARQYSVPWMTYFASAIKTPDSLVYISDSLFYRQIMLSYCLGCNTWMEEKGWYLEEGPEGYPYLSRYARQMLRADEFIRSDPDRGVPYTPLALGLDWLHGYSASAPWLHLAWTPADSMIHELLHFMMPIQRREQGCGETDNYDLGNSTFADAMDVLVLNPPSGPVPASRLSAYKVLVLAGQIHWGEPLVGRIREYVGAGGTLLADLTNCGPALGPAFWGWTQPPALGAESTALRPLPAATVLATDEAGAPLVVRHPYGQGAVITVAVPHLLGPQNALAPCAKQILQQLHDDALPVEVLGDVEWAVSRLARGWRVMLINNRGVSTDLHALKQERVHSTAVTLDMAKTAMVRVRPRTEVASVREVLGRETPKSVLEEGRVVECGVPVLPGEVALLELWEPQSPEP